MGTRGLFGFYYKGKYYLVYNHYGSYLEGLGMSIVQQIKQAIEDGKLEEWKNKIIELKEVGHEPPTKEEIEHLKQYANLGVAGRSLCDWYCLLRHTQGSLQNVLDAGYIVNRAIDNKCPDINGDSDIEYMYIVNLDSNELNCVSYSDSFDYTDSNFEPHSEDSEYSDSEVSDSEVSDAIYFKSYSFDNLPNWNH
jgi:hypothetical protein